MRIAEMIVGGLLASAGWTCFAQMGSHAPGGLIVVVKEPLSLQANGINGMLELLQDARLTPKLIEQMWGTGGVDIDDDPTLAMFRNDAPLNAELRLVSTDGKLVQREPIERPLVRLKEIHLYGDGPINYQVTVDYSAGFGSYSGPITSFVEVRKGHFNWIEASGETGKLEKIALMESLKTTWKQVPAQAGRASQFLEASCRPKDFGSNDPKFQITYKRIYFDGKQWRSIARIVNGFTEFDNGFPPRRMFP